MNPLQLAHYLAKCEDQFRRYSGSPSIIEPKLKELKKTANDAKSEPEPRFRCTNVFEDDGARCRRARERAKRYCERCAKMRRRESTRQAVQKSRVACKQNAFISASA